jgi:chromatin remodeling complex protein RSC6
MEITEIQNKLHKLKKRAQRNERKQKKKAEKKNQQDKADSDVSKIPKGFAKTYPLSEELKQFLGLSVGVPVVQTRPEVVKQIWQHAANRGLIQIDSATKKKWLHPDDSLATLLNVPRSELIAYKCLQTYLLPHFLSNV